MKLKQVSEELSTVDLLVMLLLRFPEIFTINYNLLKSRFELSFMLEKNLGDNKYRKFKENFENATMAYIELSKQESAIPKLSYKAIDSWTLLRVTWEKGNIAFEEVNLVNQIIRSEFKDVLVLDSRVEGLLERDASSNEEFIEFLHPKRNENDEENLFAYREAGKVYVYDK
ncbi:MAG TPA: hypothetical protein GXZ24_04480 [Firmicutes bacterium]|nr:hypothetical protein [Bacillota bacterium]